MRYKMFSIHYDRTFKKQTNCVQLAVQLLSRVQLCDPMDCSMPGSSLLQYLTEFAQTLVHWVSDAIQPSQPLLPLSPPDLNLSQHQGLFPMSPIFPPVGQRTGTSASASVLPMNVQDWFPLELKIWSPCCPRGSQESSPSSQFVPINSLVLSLLYGPTLTSVHGYWKNHSFDHADLSQQSDISAF